MTDMLSAAERLGTTRARGQRPGQRPQQDPQKNEGSDTCVGLDQSGTVTNELMTGPGTPSVSKCCIRALRAGDEDGHQAPHGATQLPVRPRRGSQESTAGARGRAADGSVVVLGTSHRTAKVL